MTGESIRRRNRYSMLHKEARDHRRGLPLSPRRRGRQQLIDDRLLQLSDALLVAGVYRKASDLLGLDQPHANQDRHLFRERRLRAAELLREGRGGHSQRTSLTVSRPRKRAGI